MHCVGGCLWVTLRAFLEARIFVLRYRGRRRVFRHESRYTLTNRANVRYFSTTHAATFPFS